MIYAICVGLLRLIYAILFPLKIVGKENVPKEGGVLLCANHISLLDPMTIGIKLDRQVKYMAKAELFEVPVLGWLINKLGAFPVKRGGVSKESIKTALNTLRNGNVMGIFPEGTRNSDAGVAKKVLLALHFEVAQQLFQRLLSASINPFDAWSLSTVLL